MQNTFKYINSLLLCLFVFSVQAQKQKNIEAPPTITAPFFNGIFVQVDVASAVSSFLSKGETYSYEAAVQADFRHKLFPVVELGVGGANKLTTDNIGFKTNGLFGRIGVDLNIISPKKDQKPTTNLFLAGIRLGMTSFKYDISNVIITDDYWGGSQLIPYNGNSCTKVWYEISAGVRVEVVKNIFMGWTVRTKSLITQDKAGNASPWYIPGYGVNNGGNWAINYTIGYKFQLPLKHKHVVETKNTETLIKH